MVYRIARKKSLTFVGTDVRATSIDQGGKAMLIKCHSKASRGSFGF